MGDISICDELGRNTLETSLYRNKEDIFLTSNPDLHPYNITNFIPRSYGEHIRFCILYRFAIKKKKKKEKNLTPAEPPMTLAVCIQHLKTTQAGNGS